jgi:hypothetical protein
LDRESFLKRPPAHGTHKVQTADIQSPTEMLFAVGMRCTACGARVRREVGLREYERTISSVLNEIVSEFRSKVDPDCDTHRKTLIVSEVQES